MWPYTPGQAALPLVAFRRWSCISYMWSYISYLWSYVLYIWSYISDWWSYISYMWSYITAGQRAAGRLFCICLRNARHRRPVMPVARTPSPPRTVHLGPYGGLEREGGLGLASDERGTPVGRGGGLWPAIGAQKALVFAGAQKALAMGARKSPVSMGTCASACATPGITGSILPVARAPSPVQGRHPAGGRRYYRSEHIH